MKFFICALALVAAASAAPQYVNPPYNPQSLTKDGLARIVQYDQNQQENGNYQWSFKTENGIAAGETNIQEPAPPSGEPSPHVKGGYSYTAPDGSPVDVTYEAGPNGFVPVGNVIPQIPKEILDSLAWNAAHPEEEAQWDPAYKGVSQPGYVQGRK